MLIISKLKGKYVRSTKLFLLTYTNLAGEHTRGGGCGLIGFNARNLTREDSRMRVSLKGLPNKLRLEE